MFLPFKRLVLTHHSYYGDMGHPYPSSTCGCAIGLCTGLLSSAAVSCSQTVGELVSIAVDTVVVAVRLGFCVSRIQDMVAFGEPASPSWCALVSGLDERDALNMIDEFSCKRVRFNNTRPLRNWL